MQLSEGQQVGGRYIVAKSLARSGPTESWRAQDVVFDRPVVVKVLRKEHIKDPASLARLRNEARIGATLSHPNIAPVYDYGGDENRAGEPFEYLVREFVDGEPLSTILQNEGRLDVDRTFRLLSQVVDALGAAHRAGVVHRGVEPGIITVRPDGVAKLTDFGILRIIEAPITDPGVTIRHPLYFAPEQAQDEEVTPASDVYALGVIAYECLTGHRPFDGTSPVAVALAQVNRLPPPLPPHIPSAVRALVERALARNPAGRFRDGEALLEAIRAVGGDTGPKAPASGGVQPLARVEQLPPADGRRKGAKVFLCHSTGDKQQVRALYHRLGRDGVECWLDERDLLPGQDWDLEIRKAIRACRYVVVCLSRGSITRSGYVQKEIRTALDIADEQPEGSVFLIPVRLEPCEVPDRLRRWHWVDLFAANGYDRLLRGFLAGG